MFLSNTDYWIFIWTPYKLVITLWNKMKILLCYPFYFNETIRIITKHINILLKVAPILEDQSLRQEILLYYKTCFKSFENSDLMQCLWDFFKWKCVFESSEWCRRNGFYKIEWFWGVMKLSAFDYWPCLTFRKKLEAKCTRL